MLPDEDGLTILRKLRDSAQTARLPVIMLTAKGTEYDKVIGLDSGADDYIPKPFGMMELVSRVRALLRRAEPEKKGGLLQVGPIAVDAAKHTVKVNDQAVVLTFKEFELLCYLMENEEWFLQEISCCPESGAMILMGRQGLWTFISGLFGRNWGQPAAILKPSAA